MFAGNFLPVIYFKFDPFNNIVKVVFPNYHRVDVEYQYASRLFRTELLTNKAPIFSDVSDRGRLVLKDSVGG